MRDGLRQEFPEVAAVAGRIPGPRVARAPLFWSVVGAFGASFFVHAVVIVSLSLVFRVLAVAGGAPVPAPFELAAVASLGTGLAVAFVAGGRQAVAVYAAIVVFERLAGLWGFARFCGQISPAPSSCSFLAYVVGLWPQALAVVLAYGLARWVRTSGTGGNPKLEPAGALALTNSLLGVALGVVLVSAGDLASGLLNIAAAVTTGIACGLVLLARVAPAARWRVLGLVALGVVGPWLAVSLPSFLEQIGVGGGIAISGFVLLGFAYPLLQIGGAALVLYMAAARMVRPEA
jgi:hypothetical protein